MKTIEEMVQPGGGLYYSKSYFLSWCPEDDQPDIVLDGIFTPAELRSLADYMDRIRPPASE